jgi:hypothetical protein
MVYTAMMSQSSLGRMRFSAMLANISLGDRGHCERQGRSRNTYVMECHQNWILFIFATSAPALDLYAQSWQCRHRNRSSFPCFAPLGQDPRQSDRPVCHYTKLGPLYRPTGQSIINNRLNTRYSRPFIIRKPAGLSHVSSRSICSTKTTRLTGINLDVIRHFSKGNFFLFGHSNVSTSPVTEFSPSLVHWSCLVKK